MFAGAWCRTMDEPQTEAPMTTYRVYTVGKYGQFLAVKRFDAATDEEALTIARQSLSGSELEVWTGDRKVGVV
jgi:hypothetical protein